MKIVDIYPNRLKQFGDPKDCVFCLITNSNLTKSFNIKIDHGYQSSLIISYDQEQNFSELLKSKVPENSHILIIMPDCYFHSPKPETLGKKRKLIIMANNSTPTSLEAIEHFMRCGEKTEPADLDAIADKFFETIQSAEQLYFVEEEYKTKAVFNHVSDKLQWHQQAGALQWGQQQLFPSGEMSTLPLDVYEMDIKTSFELNGEITFRGYPVLHSGKASYLPQDQERIFQKLISLEHHSIIAKVQDGIIVELTHTTHDSKSIISMLEAMFELDSRYRTIIEIGFGINYWLKLFKGNSAMNEVYAANRGGTIHWGLGLTPFTQYHLDVLCPQTSVLNEKKEIIFGRNNKQFHSL